MTAFCLWLLQQTHCRDLGGGKDGAGGGQGGAGGVSQWLQGGAYCSKDCQEEACMGAVYALTVKPVHCTFMTK